MVHSESCCPERSVCVCVWKYMDLNDQKSLRCAFLQTVWQQPRLPPSKVFAFPWCNRCLLCVSLHFSTLYCFGTCFLTVHIIFICILGAVRLQPMAISIFRILHHHFYHVFVLSPHLLSHSEIFPIRFILHFINFPIQSLPCFYVYVFSCHCRPS